MNMKEFPYEDRQAYFELSHNIAFRDVLIELRKGGRCIYGNQDHGACDACGRNIERITKTIERGEEIKRRIDEVEGIFA